MSCIVVSCIVVSCIVVSCIDDNVSYKRVFLIEMVDLWICVIFNNCLEAKLSDALLLQ